MKYIIFTLALIVSMGINAQDRSTKLLYGAGFSQEGLRWNPALEQSNDYYIGVPILGHVQAGAWLSGFNFKTAVARRNSTETFVDIDGLSDAINDNSFLQAHVYTDILSAGLRAYDGGFWSMNFGVKAEATYRFSDGFTDLLLFGNAAEQNIGKTLDISSQQVWAQAYSNLSVGYNRRINKNWRVGARFSILSGLGYAGILENDLSLTTDDRIQTIGDISIDGGMKIGVGGIAADVDNISNSPFNFSNLGIAGDLGASYIVNPNLVLSGSILDLGFIRWGSSSETYSVDLEDGVVFNGINYQINGDKEIGDEFDEWYNANEERLDLDTAVEGFTTYLGTRYILGGTYTLGKRVTLNAFTEMQRMIGGGQIFNASLNSHIALTKGFTLMAGASVYNGDPELGFGFNASIKSVNVFLLLDNVNVWDVRRAQGTTFAMGISVRNNRKKRKNNNARTRWMREESEREKADTQKEKKKKKKKKTKEATKKDTSSKEKKSTRLDKKREKYDRKKSKKSDGDL